jgi:hypothetical protein
MNIPNMPADEQQFRDRFCGVPSHVICKALNALVRGRDFRKCSKEVLGEVWAERLTDERMQGLTLDDVAAEVIKLMPAKSEELTMPAPPRGTMLASQLKPGLYKLLHSVGNRGFDGRVRCDWRRTNKIFKAGTEFRVEAYTGLEGDHVYAHTIRPRDAEYAHQVVFAPMKSKAPADPIAEAIVPHLQRVGDLEMAMSPEEKIKALELENARLKQQLEHLQPEHH